MVKLYTSFLAFALTLATSSALAFSQQPRGGINILRRRDLDPEFSRREFFLDARDIDSGAYYDLEARAMPSFLSYSSDTEKKKEEKKLRNLKKLKKSKLGKYLL